jgi:integrase
LTIFTTKGSFDLFRRRPKIPSCCRLLPGYWIFFKETRGKAPTVCEQYFNREIKKICKKNGLIDPIFKTVSNGGQKYTITKEKWEMVSSHTARRTGATNMYKAGIPTLAIMKVTGHTSESSFLKYIKISKEENARMLANHPHFKKN